MPYPTTTIADGASRVKPSDARNAEVAMTSATIAMTSQVQAENGGMRIVSDLRERELRVVGAELRAERFDHQFVIGALRQARDGDRADHARTLHRERKRTAMRREIAVGQAVLFGKRRA